MSLTTETIDGFQVRLWCEGQGPPLLYLHGFEHHPGGASFLRRLATGRRVFAPELPGYGGSTGFEAIDGVLGLTLYHRRLVESWAAGPVDVVGHSLGGMFAAEFAALCPHLTRRLVLVNAYGLWLDHVGMADPFTLSEAELAAAKWADPARARTEPSIVVSDPAQPHQAGLDRARNLGTATKFMWPIADRGLRRRLGYIHAPTLVVHGAADGLIPAAYADEFGRLIPNARVLHLDGAGHLPMVEREHAFVSAVEGFLSE